MANSFPNSYSDFTTLFYDFNRKDNLGIFIYMPLPYVCMQLVFLISANSVRLIPNLILAVLSPSKTYKGCHYCPNS